MVATMRDQVKRSVLTMMATIVLVIIGVAATDTTTVVAMDIRIMEEMATTTMATGAATMEEEMATTMEAMAVPATTTMLAGEISVKWNALSAKKQDTKLLSVPRRRLMMELNQIRFRRQR